MRFVETVDKINGLPVGFKEVEYLESTGVQYIDTGIAGSSTLKIEMNGQKSGASFGVYFGAGTGNNRIQAIYLDNYNSARIGDVTNTHLGRDTEKFNIVVDTLNKNVIYNGTTYPFAYTSALTTLNIFIFTRNEGGSFADKASAKCWSFKIWDNNALVRDFIPCLDNNGRPCMYDLVGKKAYYNLGTGADFSYGREIHPVEYLESTGTQYINMGIKSSANMSVKAKFNLSDVSTKAVFGSYSGPSTNGVGVFFGTAGGNIPGKVYCNNTNVAVSPDLTLSTNTNYEIEMSGTTLVINGSTYTSEATASNSYDMLLFARSNNGTVERQISGKIYNLKIWDNGTIARNYIPCIDENNVPFMFDRVTHTAFLNAGTDEFLYGNPVASNKGKIRFPMTQHEKSRLPLGFREVEYLESTGEQWIDTGVAPSNITPIVKLKFIPTQLYSSGNYGIFGCFGANNNRFQIFYNSIGIGTYVSKTWPANTAYEVELNGKVPFATVNGTVETSGYSNANGFSSYNMYLFTRNSADVADNGVPLKLYYCKLWNNDVLIRDFIPCLDNNGIPCMYDLVGKKPYYNQGTGDDFSYGREIHYVEYLESTGTQYINTGVSGNNPNLKIEVDAKTYEFGWCHQNNANGAWVDAFSFPNDNLERVNYGNYALAKDFEYDRVTRKTRTFDFKTGFYIDGVLKQSFVITNYSQLTPNLSIFGRYNFNSNSYTILKNSSYTIYGTKIYDNNTLVRDYIPAIDENNVPFMFDRVTHTAFLNAGTGEFLYGNLLKQSKIRIVLPPTIPLIYKPVEYLESTGEQYIDTGLLSTANSKVDCVFGFTSMESGVANNVGVFGGRNAQQSTTFTLFKIASGNPQYFRFDYDGQTTVATANQMTWNTTSKYRFEYDGTKYTTTNTTTSQSNTAILNPSSTFTTSPICLFAVNTSGIIGQYLSGRIYKYWYTDGTNTIDLVPVIRRSDEKPGFYCKVTKQFFTNAGTGEFLYG